MPLLVLGKDIRLEAGSILLGLLKDVLLELAERIALQTVSDRVVKPETVSFCLVFDVCFLDVLIHKGGESLCPGLVNGVVLEFVVEIVTAFRKIGLAGEIIEFQTCGLRGGVDCIDELSLVEFLSGDGDNAVHFLDHVDTRSVSERGGCLNDVIHIVAVKSAERGHKRAVLLALHKFVKLVEPCIRILELVGLLELIIVEMREKRGLDAVVQHKSGTAFR